MKTFKSLILVLGLLFLTFLANAQLTATLTFDVPDLKFDTINGYTQPSFFGCQFTDVIGAPHMPVIIKQYLLPKNAEIIDISFSDTTHFTFPASYLVYPTQTPAILDGRPAPPFVEPDSVYYSSNSRYNGELIEIEALTNYLGYTMVRLRVFPLQYIPSELELTLFNSITFTVNYQITGTDPLIKKMTSHQYEEIHEFLAQTVDNPEDIDESGPICEFIEPPSEGTRPLNLFFLPWAGGDVVEYIIITNDELKSSFDELAEWKMGKGIPVLVVTTSQIEEYYPGFDLAEKIFNYLKDVRNNWGDAIYVLLGGDTGIIPSRIATYECDQYTGSCFLRVTDLYFSDVHKDNNENYNWNPDGDCDFWDDDNSLDLFPDNWIGRAPVKNIEETNNFVNKIKQYEQNKFQNCIEKITLIGANLRRCMNENDSGDARGMKFWMNPVFDALPGNLQNSTTRIYDLDVINWYEDYELNKDIVLDALKGDIEEGEQHIFAHIDHSGFSSLGTSQLCNNSCISLNDMNNLELEADDILKIMFSGGCQPNEINKDCIAEHFINGSGINNFHGIGIGFIGNIGFGWENGEPQCHKFFEKLYNDTLFNLGKIFYESRIAMSEVDGRFYKRNLNFLGDPELQVWTSSIKQDLEITVNPSSLTTGVNNLMVTIDGLSPNEQALVCIFKDNEVYGVKKTTGPWGTHDVTFNCKPDTPGQIRIRATAANHLYADTTINVAVNSEPDVHLYIKDFDPNNLDLHRGVNKFKILLENSGNIIDATGIKATLSTEPGYATITQGSSEYEDIGPGSSQPSISEFEITIDNDTPDLLFIPFSLQILSNDDQYSFIEEFFLQVKASQLVYRGNKISWSTDGDIFADPAESVHFNVELLNTGSLNAVITEAVIELDSLYNYIISIQNGQYPGQVSFNPIEPLNSSWCVGSFEVTMNANLGFTATFPIKLKIKDSNNKNYVFDILINNKIKPDSIAYFSDNASITITWDPLPLSISKGFNIYRLDPDTLPPGGDIEDSNYYQRLNLYINNFSVYTDVNVETCKVYYYKISSYTNGLPQGPFTTALKAWTTLPSLEPWPLFVPDYGLRSEGSPILYNAIPTKVVEGDNPELEIFFPMDDGSSGIYTASKSALYAFYSNGDELYNIDSNITTYAGFKNFSNAGMKATPIIGEMNNNPSYGEVAFATTDGTSSEDHKKIFLYSAGDPDEDKKPDLIHKYGENHFVKNALVASPLDLNYQEDIQIIGANIWHGQLNVQWTYEHDNSWIYPGWPKVAVDTTTNGIPVVADLDLNEKKEIIIGYEGSAGLFIYNYDGSKYRGISGAFYVPQEWQNLIGMDCRPVVAELDHSDVNPEIILLSAYSDKKAHIFALNHDQSEVTNWTYDQTNHIIDISSTDNGNYPALTVADLDFDGIIEVIIADAGKVYAWKATGEYFNGHFPIEVEGLECPYVAPLVANVDKDPESEIIIADPVNNFIYAFNLDGSQVPGWPLAVDGLMATPAIGDVNHDGLNEIVAVYGGYVNVWKTDGETGHDQWPLYRLNSFNNAVYEEPACTYDPNDPWTIDPEVDPLVWDDYKVLTRDIIIPEDVTLTITGRVAMPDDSKIIVQRGGRLVVDGGIITSACGGLWQGIQVWGYKDKSQYDLNFPPGKVELSGNAVIENARIGVATVKSVNGAVDENYTGGELLCREATFLNNIYGIRFYNYRNFDPYNPPHNELDYASYISNSTFITNGHLAENGASPVAFIRMDDVVGIRLSGNQFMNTSGEEYNWNSRGNGIESYNAAYFMHGLCLDGNPPCSLFKKNYFYNLSYGIKSHGQGRENRSITVLNSDFHLNQKGMFVSCINNANINFNTFTVPEKSTGNEIPRYGLYLEICSGYTIEENSFQGWGDGLDENIGMYINNSGSEPNEVYKNDFSDLAYGIVAYGQNRNETGEGLCLKCNNFDLCMNDIHVIPEKGPPHGLWLQGRNQGIAQNQGNGSSLTSLAGNTFSFGDPPVFNYFNHDYCNNITYNYHGENETDYKISPDPYSPEPLVDPKPAFGYTFESKDAACPSNYGGGGINLSLEKSVVSSEKGLVTLYSDSIQTFLDGGDTYALNFEVVTSLPDEAYQIRQQLLDESPYLSDTVMKSAIYKENVLPNAMIRDVLVANPQSAKSSEIIERVNERIEPMPEEMMYDILEGRNIKGNLEILEGKLASHMTFKYESLHKLELYYKLDTIDILGSQDSLIALWSMENDPEILYKLAFLYLNKHDSTNCFNTLNSIPQSSTLTDKQMLEYDDYSLLLEILWNLNHNTTNLDSTLVGPLSELMSHNSKPGYLARNVLIANGIIEYIEPIYLAYELKSVFVNPNKSGDTKSYKSNLIVFPNPAKNYIIVSYDLKERQGKSSISISSIDGKPCYQEYLNGIKNQTIISLSGFSSGVYCIQLKNNGEIIGTVKFVISK